MAMKKPKIGDAVIHQGRRHDIIELPLKAIKRDGDAVIAERVRFKNEYVDSVLANMPDFIWSDADDAWYLGGRLLANDERILYEVLLGVRTPPETHMAGRTFLDSIDYADVPRERLLKIVGSRKMTTDAETGKLRALTEKEVEEYADACLVHCTELKEARNG